MKKFLLASNLLLFVFILSTLQAATLKIGTDRWPPYEDLQNKNQPGYSTEVVKAVLESMGNSMEIKEYPWARAVKNVYDGKTDALFSATYTEERAKNCYFPSEPLLMSKYVLFIKAENKGTHKFDEYDDLKGKQIGLVRSFAYSKEFWDFVKKNKNYQTVNNDGLNLKKLMKGRIDYFIADYGNGMSLIKEMKLSGKVIPLLNKPVREDGLNVIFSKKTTSKEFVEKFSKALKNFKKTDKFKKIWNSYFGG